MHDLHYKDANRTDSTGCKGNGRGSSELDRRKRDSGQRQKVRHLYYVKMRFRANS